MNALEPTNSVSGKPAQASEKRAVLLRALTKCFFIRAGRHSELELELYDAVIEIVAARVEPIARAELARRLAKEKRPPPRTLLLLARDAIEVAEPILLHSPALNERQLLEFVLTLSQMHLTAIARRAHVSQRVSDMLVARGDETVHVCLAANHGAHISAAAFSKLADCAASHHDLCGRLAARPDIPEEIVIRLEPVIHLNLDAILAAFALDVDRNGRAALIEGANAALLGRLKAASTPARPLPVLADLVARELMLFDDALIELADADDAMGVAQLLLRRTELRPDVIMRVLFAAPDEPMMLLCRAAKLDLDAFSAVLRMRRRRRGAARQSPAAALSAYAAIDPEAAAAVVLGADKAGGGKATRIRTAHKSPRRNHPP